MDLNKLVGICRYFQMQFLRLRNINFYLRLLKVINGSGNDPAPNRRRAISCSTDDPVHWLKYESPDVKEFNSLRPKRNEQHFADDNLKRIFFNENVWISIKISLKFVPNGPINNISALVQIMAWRRSGDKPLSEPMMVGLPTHIYMRHSASELRRTVLTLQRWSSFLKLIWHGTQLIFYVWKSIIIPWKIVFKMRKS